MEPMHWEYMGALGGMIAIGWLLVVPMYRGWTHINDKMTARVKRSIHMMAECEDRLNPLGPGTIPPSSVEPPAAGPCGQRSMQS